MKLKEFDFHIPKEFIAQSPYEKRDEAKLLIVDRKTNKTFDKKFYDIVDYFKENDVLVLNDTKVIPARLFGIKVSTNAKIEILLLKEIKKDVWKSLAKPSKKLKENEIIYISDNLKLKLLEKLDDGICIFQLIYEGILIEILEKLGHMPLPPYITKQLNDNSNYQTIYAKNLGSAAAPTAGFHFTSEIINKLKQKNVKIVYITLEVGLGTFRPVSVDNIEEHNMHSERYFINNDACDILNDAILKKYDIIACGTTSLRALESNFDTKFHSGVFDTDIFIYPGYKFKVVDKLITNFHLPKSSLLMLVSAFYSLDKIKDIYMHAVRKNYKFFSFGDAMFLM